MYSVVEIFDTVQGEGSRAGAKSVFVRLGGCNAWNGRPEDRGKGKGACAAWCDTRFTGGKPMTAVEIEEAALRAWIGAGYIDLNQPKWVVLSGGEPMLQVDEALVGVLHLQGWRIAVETNGSIDAPVLLELDHVCVSPKRGLPLKIYGGTELKVVLPGGRDAMGGDGWTDEELAALGEIDFEHRFVQPQDPIDQGFVEVSHLHRNAADTAARAAVQDDQYRQNVRHCLEWVRRNPQWRIGLQTHKLLEVR